MTAARHLRKITLHLARTKEHPQGSARHGYDFIAPLTADGKIDAEEWAEHRNACVVHRFWGDEPPLRGHLVRKSGGKGGATWRFDYDQEDEDDDEAGYRFADHVFAPGEYVSIQDAEGELHTFKVVSATPV